MLATEINTEYKVKWLLKFKRKSIGKEGLEKIKKVVCCVEIDSIDQNEWCVEFCMCIFIFELYVCN